MRCFRRRSKLRIVGSVISEILQHCLSLKKHTTKKPLQNSYTFLLISTNIRSNVNLWKTTRQLVLHMFSENLYIILIKNITEQSLFPNLLKSFCTILYWWIWSSWTSFCQKKTTIYNFIRYALDIANQSNCPIFFFFLFLTTPSSGKPALHWSFFCKEPGYKLKYICMHTIDINF